MNLKYFRKSEFFRSGHNWFDNMSNELLIRVDICRGIANIPFDISPNEFSLGRLGRMSDSSAHNIRYHGEVKAMDIFPRYRSIKDLLYEKTHEEEALEIVRIAEMCGINGIGLYLDTKMNNKKHYMIHLDNKPRVYKWIRVDGKYLPFDEVWNQERFSDLRQLNSFITLSGS